VSQLGVSRLWRRAREDSRDFFGLVWLVFF
jgi:hypothetical protein